MKRRVRLFIGGMEVEFQSTPDILYNWKVDELMSPAAVKNSYSKTITIPGTKRNNRIFDNFFLNDYRTQGTNFDASKKTEFTIYVDSSVYETGYCKLNSVNQNKHYFSYEVQLFGGLGELFYNLEMSDNPAGEDEKRKLSSLEFYNPSGTPVELGFTINKETIADAWANIDDDSSPYSIINFAPAYNGLPSDFDADKVLINTGTLNSGSTSGGAVRHPGGARNSTITTAVTEDGKTYKTYGGYALAELKREYTGAEMREFRSYLQRPVLKVKKVLEAICLPENNGGYEVNFDSDWTQPDNPYWENLYVTLPMLSTLDYNASVVSSGTSVYLGNKASGNITTGDPGYYEDTLAYLSDSDSGMAFDVNVKLTLNIEGVSDQHHNNLVVCAYSSASNTYYASAVFVQLVAYDAVGNPVGGSDVYYITSAYGARRTGRGATGTMAAYFIPREDFNYNQPYGNGYVNAKGTYFAKVTGSTYAWNEEISLTAPNVPAGSTLKVLVTKVYKTGGTQNGAKYVFYREIQGGQITRYSAYTFNNFSVAVNSSTVAFKTNDGIRTGAGFTKKQLLDTDYSPCDFLLSYCKMFGMYFVKDPIRKKVDILTRKNFFRRNEIVDIEKYVDRSSVKTTPLVFDSKWYDWNLDADESEYGKAYEQTYGKKYGQQKINTGYNFNRSTREVLDGNVFKNAVQVLERSKAFCYTTSGLMPWAFPGYTYLLYNTADNTDTYEIEVGASSTIDAFSAFTEGYMYYDAFDKVQLHSADNNPADGNNVLLFLNGKASLKKGTISFGYVISDDNSYMNILNDGKPCWLSTRTETDTQGNSVAIKIDECPYFNRYIIYPATGYITRSLDFGQPEEIYIPNALYRPGSTIYEGFWEVYIRDLYDKDSRVMKTKMLIREKPSVDWLRRFYSFDGSLWRMTAINDFNLAQEKLTEVEFVRVQDAANYTSTAIDSAVTISVTLSEYSISRTGGTVTYDVTVPPGVQWLISYYDSQTSVSVPAGVGSGSGVWTIPVSDSNTEIQRSMIFVAENVSTEVTLTQEGYRLSLSGPNEQGDVPASGGTRTYTLVCTDSDWSAYTQYSGIITAVTPTSGSATDESGVTITASFGVNTDPTTREAYIIVELPNGSRQRSGWARQAAAGGATINVSPDFLNHIPGSGGTVELTLYSTSSWRGLVTYPDRISISPTTGDSGTTTVIATIAPNQSATTRSAQVYFYRDDSPVSNPAVFSMSQEARPEDYSTHYLTLKVVSGGTIIWKAGSTSSNSPEVSYSKDGGTTWTACGNATGATTTINVVAGDSVMLKANGSGCTFGAYMSDYNAVSRDSTAGFDVEGNIMSLLYGDDFQNYASLTQDSQFESFFEAKKVRSAKNLVLASNTVSRCYYSMFEDCVCLTEAPSELPASNAAHSAYYRMFAGCTSLSASPSINATSMEQNAAYAMFSGCTNLSSVRCLTTSRLLNATKLWLTGVSANGTFTKKSGATWDEGDGGIPSGWTVVEV